MTCLVAFFHSVPDVIWSGVIASVLTVGGVLISNGSNTKRLKLQLAHDSTEKAKERTATLRMEVSLRAVEEIVKVHAHLARLPQLDIVKVNVGDGMQNYFGAAARLQLVAEPKTALLVNQLTASYAELLLKVITRLIPAQKTKIDMQISDELYSKSQHEITRILSEMAKQNESGQRNDAAIRALQGNFDFHQKQADKYASERGEAARLFNAHSLEFFRFLLLELRKIGGQQIPVLIAIRRDLGLSGEIDALEAQMHQQWERMEKHLNEVVAAIQTGRENS